MSSILSSPGVFLATAMAVSGAVIFLALRRDRNFSPTQFSGDQNSQSANQILRSCLSSDGKKRVRKKKKVQFADGVKDQTGNCEELRRERNRKSEEIQRARACRTEMSEIHGVPANRLALYNGILRDRVQRMECSC